MTHFTQINKGYKVTLLKPDCRIYFGSKVVCEKVIRTNTFWHTDTRTALQTVCFSCLSVGGSVKNMWNNRFSGCCLCYSWTFLIVGVFHPFLFCGERFCASSQHLTVVYLSVACLHANTSAWVAYPHSFAVCSQILT